MNTLHSPRPNPEITIVAHELGKPPEAGNVLVNTIKDVGGNSVITPSLEDFYRTSSEDPGFVVVRSQVEHVERLNEVVRGVGDASLRLVGLSHGAVIVSKFLKQAKGLNIQEIIMASAFIDPPQEKLQNFFSRGEPTFDEVMEAGAGCRVSSFMKPRVVLTAEYADELFAEDFDPALDIGRAARYAEANNISHFGIMAQKDIWGGWTQERLEKYQESLGKYGMKIFEFQGDVKKSDHFYTGNEKNLAEIFLGRGDLSRLK